MATRDFITPFATKGWLAAWRSSSMRLSHPYHPPSAAKQAAQHTKLPKRFPWPAQPAISGRQKG
jgi:hypothetical protein